MAAPAAVYQCTISGILAGQFVQTVVHFGFPTNPSEASYAISNALAEALESEGWMISFLDCLPEDYTLTSVRVKKITSPGGPTAVKLASFYTASVGQRSGDISSAQVSPLIIWIAETESDLVGKTFLPGVSETDISQMQLDGPLVTEIEAFIAQHIAPMTVLTYEPSGCIWRRADAVGDVIQYGRISPLIGTLRKRLRPV